MDYLLDTHSFLWFINGSTQLSAEARRCIEDDNSDKWVSIVSFWEISIKLSLGKLQMDMNVEELEKHLFGNGFKLLPLNLKDTLLVSKLPFHHRDPFDRLLIAQAINNSLTIISRDKNFPTYNVQVVWTANS
jgi:PIN domain nuclease of toxin-antitoxin system